MQLNKQQLRQRLANLAANSQFTVVEYGFGAGLTCLMLSQLWLEQVKVPNCQLNYIAYQAQALSLAELQAQHNKLPTTLQQLAKRLTDQYYLLLPGYHRIQLAANIYLTLIIGEEATPPLYNIPLDLYINSEPTQHKLDLSANSQTPPLKPYFSYLPAPTQGSTVAIIGAGISGAATAYSLACRGYQVTVFEQHPQVASEASGNYQAILYGSWSAHSGAMMELSASAYRYTHHLIQQLLRADLDYQQCGLIQLNHEPGQSKRNQELLLANLYPDFIRAVNHEQIEAITGVKISTASSGIYFPSGLWLKPAAFVNALLAHTNITLIKNCQINSINYSDQRWQLFNNAKLTAEFPTLVICNAHAAQQFSQLADLNCTIIRGQTTTLTQPSALKSILCGDGYITPMSNGRYTLGATFQIKDSDTQVRAIDNEVNLNNFRHLIPELTSPVAPQSISGRANLRTACRDYLPLVGPIANLEQFKQVYAKLRHDANAKLNPNCPDYPGLYLNLAHGSKGMLTAPYCAELIADYISGSPLAASNNLRCALHPNRLWAKALIRRQI